MKRERETEIEREREIERETKIEMKYLKIEGAGRPKADGRRRQAQWRGEEPFLNQNIIIIIIIII